MTDSTITLPEKSSAIIIHEDLEIEVHIAEPEDKDENLSVGAIYCMAMSALFQDDEFVTTTINKFFELAKAFVKKDQESEEDDDSDDEEVSE